ncbi:MAG TPA: FlgD immunoglobulin-like domain containing protein [Candidatus Eisenbacteria bacterium]
MNLARTALVSGSVALLLSLSPAPSRADGRAMTLVGTLAPWPAGQYSNVAADATRHVAYMGSWDDQGVAVIDTRDPAHPALTDHLSTHITSDVLISDSADLDLVGRYLAVSHQRLTFGGGFEGISVYDTAADPYHPALLRRVAIPGGVHTVQLDPEVESGRPYAYANSEGSYYMYVVNIETGAIVGRYLSNEGGGCVPSDQFCAGFDFAHEGFVQRHPRSGRMLDYVSFWDGGLRIVDVTDPANPTEVGSFDYDRFTNGLTSAHYAAATPSADWVYLEDEIGYLETGGVHVLDTSACDGTSYCTPVLVGEWHIPGHPVQAAALNGLYHSGNFNPSIIAAYRRAYTYDAHNLGLRGENELLVANYTLGIRLVDTSDKTDPGETAFYLPNANQSEACKMDCDFNARNTWGAYFGSDGRIYASDLTHGFFIVDPRGRGGAPDLAAMGVAAMGGSAPAADGLEFRVRAGGGASQGGTVFSFRTPRDGPVRIAIYDAQGRLVSVAARGVMPAGPHEVSWSPRRTDGRSPARGVYFARITSTAGTASAKVVYLGE